MRRVIGLVLSLCLCLTAFPVVWAEPADALSVTARAAVLMDAGTGQVIYGHRQDVRMPIASVTKIMTLILIFEAVDAGVISLTDEIRISRTAADMGGSQVYLEAGDSHTVEELIKSIVVASANDACVAMAELLEGSEDVFVQRMNERAQELGAINTEFGNCTGLPNENAGSCAYDVAVFSRELLSHEEYFAYSSVWMDKVEHAGGRITEISNTNKLLRSYEGADGVKTGFTNEAMHCLSASALRGETRFISVILGGQSSASRFDEAAMLLDYGFAHYETVEVCRAGEALDVRIPVWGSPVKDVGVMVEKDVKILVEKGKAETMEKKVLLSEALQAPVEAGTVLGSVKFLIGDQVICEASLVSDAHAPKARFGDWWCMLWEQLVPQTCN